MNLLFAQVRLREILGLDSKQAGFAASLREMTPYLIAGLFIAVAIIAWMIHRYTVKQDNSISRALGDRRERGIIPFQFRKRRRKRKQHFSRNPTLAQTGGLPPIKEDKPGPVE